MATDKSLNVKIFVDAGTAQKEVTAFIGWLNEQFAGVGKNLAAQMGFGSFTDLKKQMGDIGKEAEKTTQKVRKAQSATGEREERRFYTTDSAWFSNRMKEVDEVKKATKKIDTRPMGPTSRLNEPLFQQSKLIQKNLDLQRKVNEAATAVPYANMIPPLRNILMTRENLLNSMKQELVNDELAKKNKAALLLLEQQRNAAVLERGASEGWIQQKQYKTGGVTAYSATEGETNKWLMKNELYADQIRQMKLVETEAFRLNEIFTRLALSMGVSPQTIASWKLQDKELKKLLVAADEADAMMGKSNIKMTKAGAFNWLTGDKGAWRYAEQDFTRAKKAAKESADVFKEFYAVQDIGSKKASQETMRLRLLMQEAYQKMQIPSSVIKSLGMTEKEIKLLIKRYTDLETAASASSNKMVTKRIKDVKAGVVVKSQGEELGTGYVSEQTVRDLDAMIKKYPQLQKYIEKSGVSMSEQHTAFSKLATTTQNYMRFQIGWFLGASVIFGIVGGITQAARASMEFSQALKDMQAVTGATNAEMNLLGETAKKVSRETPLAAQEVAALGLQLIRAGLNAESASAAMEVAAKVAVVSGEDVKTVADTIATAIMAWKIPAKDVGEIGNIIAAAMNYSRLTVEDLGIAFNYLAGVASTLNISFAETNAILAVYSNLGVRASTIATGWVQLMSEFIAPSKKAAKYLHEIGLSLKDVNPEGQSFADILEKLEGAGFKATKSLEIFQTRAGRALMFALRAGSEQFREMEEKIANTQQLTKGLATAMEGPIKAFKVFWNNLTAGAIQIGQVLMPTIYLLTSGVNLFSRAIYFNIHFLTTWPGPIIVVVTALVLLRKTLMNIMALEFAAGMSQGAYALVAMGRIAISTATALAKLKGVLQVLTAFTPGAWIVKIAAITAALAGGALLDKLFFGDTTITDLAKAKNELDENEKHLKQLDKQYKETGEQIGETTKEVTKWKEALAEVDRIDMSKTLAVWEKHNEDTQIAKDRIAAINTELAKTQDLLKVPEEKTFFQQIGADLKEWAESDWFKSFAKTIRELSEILREFGGGIKTPWKAKEKGIDTTLKLMTGQTADLLREQMTGEVEMPTIMREKPARQGSVLDYLMPGYKAQIMDLTEEKIILENENNRKFTKAADDSWKQMNKDVLAKLQESEAEKHRKAREILKSTYTESVREALSTFERAKENISGTPEQRSAALKTAQTKYDQDIDAANRLGQELLELEQKYYKKSDGNLAKDLKFRRESFADYFKSVKEGHEAELKNLQAQNALAEESDREDTAVLKDSLDEQLYWLDQFYKAGTDDAHAYYAAKRMLLEKETENEIKMMRQATDRQLADRKLQYDNAEDEITRLTTRLGEAMQSVQKIPGGKAFAGLDFIKDMAKVQERLEALPESVKSVMTSAIDDVRNYQEQIKALTTTKATMLEQMILLTVQGFNKESDAVRRLTLELEKYAYAEKLASEMQDLNRNRERIELQVEANELFKAANEVAGNWNAAESLNIELIKQRNALSEISIALRIKELQIELAEIEAKLLGADQSSVINESLRLKAEYLKTMIPLLQQVGVAQSQVNAANLAEAQLKKDNPILYGIRNVQKEWNKTNEQLVQISEQTFAGIGNAFSTMIKDDMKGEMKDFADYFEDIWDNILKYFTDIIGRMIANWIAGLFEMKAAEQTANLGSDLTATGEGGIVNNVIGGIKKLFGMGGAAATPTLATNAMGIPGSGYGSEWALSPSPAAGAKAGAGWGFGGAALGGYGIGKLIAPKSKYGGWGGLAGGMGGYALGGIAAPMVSGAISSAMLGGAAGATVLGAQIGSIVPVIGTIIGAVAGALIAKAIGKEQKKPTFQAQYQGGGQWGFQGKNGLDLSASQKRQLEDQFEDFRDVLKRYTRATGRDASVLEKPLKLGKFDIGKSSEFTKAITGSLKQYTQMTVGDDYFKALQNAGEKFEETVKRVVEGLESLQVVSRNIGYTIMNVSAMGTPLESIMTTITAALSKFDDAQKIIDRDFDKLADEALSGIGGHLTIFMTSLKKVMGGGWSNLMKGVGKAVTSFIAAFDPAALEQWMTTVSQIDPKSKFKWRDAFLALEPILDPTIKTASVEVQTAFKNFFDTMRNITGPAKVMSSIGEITLSVQEQVSGAISKLIKELGNLSNAVDPAKIAELAAGLTQAIQDQIDAVSSLVTLMADLKESLRSLKAEAVDFFVSLEQKINEYSGTESTRGSEAIATWAVKEIFKPLLDEATNRGAGGEETLTPAERIALIKAGVAAVDNWVAARTTEIEQHYNLQKQANDDQIEIINKQLDVMKAWNSLLKSVKDSIKELTLGSGNPADIVEKLTYARSEVDRMKALYEGETDTTQKAKYGEDYRVVLMDFIKTAQEAGEFMAEFQGPGAEYGKIYDFVMTELRGLEKTATAMGGTDEQILDVEKEIAAFEKANNALQESMNAEIKALKKESADYYEWLQDEGVVAYAAQGVVIATEITALQTFLDEIFGDMTFVEWRNTQIGLLEDIKGWTDTFISSQNPTNPGETNAEETYIPFNAKNPQREGFASMEVSQQILAGAKAWSEKSYGNPADYEQLFAAFQANKSMLPLAWAEPWAKSLGIALANGGLVTSPTFSLIGEKGAEWVVPYKQMQDILKMAASQEMKGGISQPITQNNTQNYDVTVSPQITINASGDASPKDIAREVEAILINSIKYGKGRVAVQDIARRKK